jgi:micrococcal nuclease
VKLKGSQKFLTGIILLLGLAASGGLLVYGLGSSQPARLELGWLRPKQAGLEATLTQPPPSIPTPSITLTPFLPLPPSATPTVSPTPSPSLTPNPSLTSTPTITPSPTPALPEGAACLPEGSLRQAATLRRLIDGDTIEVELADGALYRVRYIGINAPGSGERLFLAANTLNSELLAGKTILLVKDVSEVDRYDRLLRYVLAGDVFVNYELVRLGLAEPGSYPPDTACDETFFEAAQTARQAGLGIWAPLVAPPPADAAPAEGERGNCDPAYPTVCIPPYPPDLDCKDIPYRRFQVNPPDPHFFDGDYDGLGCEGG